MPDDIDVPVVRKGGKRVFKTFDGVVLSSEALKGLTPLEKKLIVYHNGEKRTEVETVTGKKKKIVRMKTEMVTRYDPAAPLFDVPPAPSSTSPLCVQCGLHEHQSRNPFMAYAGSKKPLVTVVFDVVTRGEDAAGRLGGAGSPDKIRQLILNSVEKTGVRLEDVRWVPLSRCANWLKKAVNLKTHGNWCRYHAVDDFQRHTPSLIIPVGTAALGLLSHKSNAQEWGGRLLTYRGWPDDWLTNPKYALPRPDPAHPGKMITGHPIFGPIPNLRIPMVPVQSPRLIELYQNPVIKARWENSIVLALKMAKDGVKALDYTRPWYEFTDDAGRIEEVLREILRTPGLLVCYDTETTGLRPWAGDAAIVSMMFRWRDPATGRPRSLGFPWNYDAFEDCEGSAVKPWIKKLKPLVWQALTQSELLGHNLTFDMLYTYVTFWRDELAGWEDARVNIARDDRMSALADACKNDTWHMAFAWQQKTGSLGLEALAYTWVPELAGYEEDMTLLIDLHYERMHPGAGKQGHYLKCPKSYWPTHVVPYVMGDVEVCHRARVRLQEKLDNSKTYQFPLADPAREGCFRYFEPPNRDWVYHQVMAPAAQTLMKMMARGLYISPHELRELELGMPAKINELRNDLRAVNPRIEEWCAAMAATHAKDNNGEEWALDLENKTQLKELLFKQLGLPVLRLTKSGRKLLGEDIVEVKRSMTRAIMDETPELRDQPDKVAAMVEVNLREMAAVDKFTLNKYLAEHKNLQPLNDYRKHFKLYSTYVRPLRNMFSQGLDKKERVGDPHLCFDQCIHASFMLTGTRGGRLSCRDPNLQQLPRDGLVKSMFVSRFGARGCLYQGDLSQIELRLLAAACGDPTMVKAYFDDVDLHSLTTSRIFDVDQEKFSKGYMKKLQDKGLNKEAKLLDEQRSIGKTVNFLTGYGGGAFGLQNILAMKGISKSIEECQEIIELFFDSYPSLRRLLQKYKRFILDSHVAVSIFGRVRVFEEVLGNDEEAKAKALRAGCNHLIQSTASDMMLTALFVIEAMMRNAGLESILVSTVHDSLVIDCVRTELPKVHEIVLRVLNNFPGVFKTVFGPGYDTSWMIVPFTGDCEVGIDYLRQNKIPKTDIDWDKLLAPVVKAA